MLSFDFELLRNQRRQRGLTQVQWATVLNVSTSKVGSWERGDCVPNVEELCNIAAVCGVSDISIYFHERISGQNENLYKG